MVTTTMHRPVWQAPLPRTCRELLADAGRELGRAIGAREASERYASAHLAALRGAAAVLATRARPRRMAQRSAWELLSALAPEFDQWSLYFSAGAATRQRIDAGVGSDVTPREADDMVRQASAFLNLVDRVLAER